MAHVVGACENCLHRKGNECDAIREPAYLWRRGRKCWAYTEDARALQRRYRDIYRHFTPARFEQLVKEFQEQEGKIMSHKGNEYSDQEDRLLNFREVAEFLGRTPAEVALAYLMKHIQSIALAVRTGKYAWAWETEGGEGLKQRIADARNYLLFLAACLEEGEDAD